MPVVAYSPPAVAELLISRPDGQVLAQRRLDPARAYWIGRESHCDFVMDHPDVSRRHALIFQVHGRWIISDTGSLNGLETESGPIRSGRLSAEAWVEIGGAYLWLAGGSRSVPDFTEWTPPVAAPQAESAPSPVQLASERLPGDRAGDDILNIVADEPVAAAGPSGESSAGIDASELLVIADDGGRVHLCADLSQLAAIRGSGSPRIVIGRAAQADLRIGHSSIDLLHCVLVRGAERWSIVDAGSSSGIFHAGKRWYRKRLDAGTNIPIGRFSLGIHRIARAGAPSASISGGFGASDAGTAATRRGAPTRPSAFLDDSDRRG